MSAVLCFFGSPLATKEMCRLAQVAANRAAESGNIERVITADMEGINQVAAEASAQAGLPLTVFGREEKPTHITCGDYVRATWLWYYDNKYPYMLEEYRIRYSAQICAPKMIADKVARLSDRGFLIWDGRDPLTYAAYVWLRWEKKEVMLKDFRLSDIELARLAREKEEARLLSEKSWTPTPKSEIQKRQKAARKAAKAAK